MEQLSPFFEGILGVILLTSFVKILAALSILRIGLGLTGSGFGVVTAVLAFALSLVVSAPQITPREATTLAHSAELTSESHLATLRSSADPRLVTLLAKVAVKTVPEQAPASTPDEQATKSAEAVPPSAVIAAFVLTGVRDACIIGAAFLIPFVVVDLLVATLLTLLGMTQLSALVVSLPCKLLLFLAVDGWSLVATRILGVVR